MALNKLINYRNGTSATYHNIGTVQSYYKDAAGYDVTVHSYVDKAAREDGTPLDSKVYRLAAPVPYEEAVIDSTGEEVEPGQAEVPFNPSLVRADLYDLLKKHPDFDGATDA